ncbi:hypothetical protein F4779DRAFT_282366 [Xylariaceae sp. FL0662B]|nr:hypothetical protein F4779DRAFT_282366 [Xylariaceae sp. FL0662B]
MLVLIAGITGMCGQPIAREALAKGHAVRGLARHPGKLDRDIAPKLERSVQTSGVYDLVALSKAVQGVDAVICAYPPEPELVVEGQLLLLRAAERARVKIFHAASWNFDWTRLKLGDIETYDWYITFAQHAKLSSTIRPLFGFTGLILEYMFIHTTRPKMLDGNSQTINFFGDGNKRSPYTAVDDLAAYTVRAISAPDAAKGGCYRVESCQLSPLEMADVYDEVRGTKLERKSSGSAQDLEVMLAEARDSFSPLDFEKYIALVYAKHVLDGSFDAESPDCARWGDVKQTSFRDWLIDHPEA